MSRPFMLIGAVFFASLSIFSFLEPGAVAAVFAAAALLLCVAAVFRRLPYMRLVLLGLACLVASSGLYLAKTYKEYLPALELCDGEGRDITCTAESVERKNGAYYADCRDVTVDGRRLDSPLTVYLKNCPEVKPGDRISLDGAVIRTRGEDRTAHLGYKAEGGAFITSRYDSAYFRAGETGGIKGAINRIRQRLSAGIAAIAPGDIAALADAVLTGDQSGLSDGVKLDFRYSGLAHLFAVSGLHLTVWTGLIFFLFGSSPRARRPRAVVSLLFIVFYVCLTGFSKSVLRSGLMLSVMNIAAFIKPEYDSISALFFAVTAILFADPFAVASLSLQLSFLAVLGIIIILPELRAKTAARIRSFKPKTLAFAADKLFAAAALSLVTSVCSLPVTAPRFGYFAPIGLVSNLLGVIPAEIFMVAAGIGSLVSGINFLRVPAAAVINALGRYLLFLTQRLSRVRYGVVPTAPGWVTLLFVLIAGAAVAAVVILTAVRKRKAIGRIFILTISAVLVVSCVSLWYNDNVMYVTAVDVGEGISVTARVNGEFVLLGCGADKYSAYRLDRALDANNRRDIAFMLVPGAEAGYSSCYGDIIWDYEVGTLVLPPEHTGGALAGKVLTGGRGAAVLDRRTAVSFVIEGDSRAAYLKRGDFGCLILFSQNTSGLPAEWMEADLLICEGRLPDIPLDGFGRVFVSDSAYRSVTEPGGKISTTSAGGDLTYTVW